MRDDTASLAAKITDHYGTKILLLEELLRREQDLSHTILRDPEEIDSVLDLCSGIMDRITDIDCDISTTRDRLCSIAGISPHDIEAGIKDGDPSIFAEWEKRQKRIKELLRGITSLRDETIRSLENLAKRTASDANELARMQNLLGRYRL